MKSQHTRRTRKLATAGLLLAAVLFSLPAFSRTPAQKKQLAAEHFDSAEQMRSELMSTPAAQRTRRTYQQLTDAYRRVYYLAPTFNRADEAVANVGDLLAETARTFDEAKLSQSAIGQYEFLRREYPGSKFRVTALYAIALIYRDDLRNTEKARSTFQEFVHRYPRSPLAEDARKALADLEQQKKPAKRQPILVRDEVLGPMPIKAAASEAARSTSEEAPLPAPKSKRTPAVQLAVETPAAQGAVVTAEDKPQSKAEHRSTLPLVTGIRYWSTPDYTRVAIDLESEVEYEAGRIASPDRIFFDLHNTKLASSLVGKTFDVEDGFLLKIRVAQYQLKMARIVLDVDNISDYSAFLLPNPYRLIIDIHGKKMSRTVKTASAKPPVNTPGANVNASTAVPVATVTKPAAASATNAAKPEPNKVESAKAEPQPELTKKPTVEPKPADVKLAKEETKREDITTAAAKNGQPELKATTKPTSAPTYESVAPRDEILPKATRRKRTPQPDLAHEARPTASGERSLTRALGLKIGRIVIDAGHGGHDTGTIGPSGLQEKDLVLDVALRLGKLLQRQMNAEVVYTRSDDTFIPLETRTAIANQQQADLFISVHANSSRDPSARGVETYYLNFTSSPEALEVAARENAVSEKSIHELQDLVKKITLKDKIDESREFASDVQRSLYSGISAKSPTIRNRGVKKAPFIVLIGANMPSILAEISFLSNPTDEKKLFTPDYREKIAEYLYKGIDRYVEGLSGLKVASRDVPPSTSRTAKVTADSDR